MTELKTLKDLRARKTHSDSECVSKDFLRKEVINWIKIPDMELWEFLKDIVEDGDVNDIYVQDRIKENVQHNKEGD